MRPKRKAYFLEIASVVAKRSTCPRLQVGAVLVNLDAQIISTGYNGAPRYEDHCVDVGCDMEDRHCIRAVHAEINAIAQAAKNGVSTKNTILYCTHKPCKRCCAILINAGVTHWYWTSEYTSPIVITEGSLVS